VTAATTSLPAAPRHRHHEPHGQGSAYTLRCRLGPCTQPARPIRAEGRRTALTASVKRRRNSSTDSSRHGAAYGGNSIHSANNLLRIPPPCLTSAGLCSGAAHPSPR
jgi:hypothetical protein